MSCKKMKATECRLKLVIIKTYITYIIYNNWLSGNVFFVIDNFGTWDKQFCVKWPLNQSNVCQSIDSFDKIFKHVCLHWN